MAFFESKEERQRRLEEEAQEEAFQEEQRRLQQEAEENSEWEAEKNEYLESIQNEIDDGDNIICIQQTDPDIKQAAMNYLFKKGYVCVQNDVVANKWDVYHVVTFAKADMVDKFFFDKR